MKKTLLAASLAVFAFPMIAISGPIDSACMRSDRKAANRQLCGCIQQAADMTLTNADQRRAAKFFSDPDEAQEVRMSKSDRDNQFWARYRAFGEMAEAYCSAG